MINLRPSGIEWENKEILMQSRGLSNTYKDRQSVRVKEDSERGKAAILLEDNACDDDAYSFDIVVTNDYVSIVPVRVVTFNNDYYNSDIESFIDPLTSFKTVCSHYLSDKTITENSPEVRTEIRIYKDLKISVVNKIGDKFYCVKDINSTSISCATGADEASFIEVSTDDEVKAQSQKVTKAHRTLNAVLFNGKDLECGYNVLNATNNKIERKGYYYSVKRFGDELEEELKTFFNSIVDIKSFVNLQDALIAHPAISTGASTGQYTIHYLDNRNVLVERQGDFIIISQKKGENDYGYVLFDTKRKTCFKSSWGGSLTSFNVANDAGGYSYRNIFDTGRHYYGDDEDACDRYITYNQDLKEVYKGTLIEFLLNLPPEKDVLYPTNTEEEVRISNILANGSNVKNISLLLRMLVCGKYKFYEQLAKSQLVNLFLWFVELKASKVRIDYAWLSCYNEKGSNLKDALGLNMAQLRLIDEIVATVKKPDGEPSNYRHTTGHYNQPCIHFLRLSKVGFRIDSNTDLNSLKKIIGFATQWSSCYGYWDVNREYSDLQAVMSKMKVSEQIAFFEKYELAGLDDDKLRVVNDYYMGRDQLVSLHESTAGYPVKPDKSTKFIRYLEGMNLTNDRWHDINSATEFREQIQDRYANYEFVKDEHDELTGAIVSFTPYENLDNLHLEMGHILSLHNDEIKQAEFARAINRVQPLEWKDEALGLALIAPKDMGDIRKEASVLSHCVASYIDPICKGSENIMFIRRLDHLDDPYFTLEIIDKGVERKNRITKGEVRQLHCYRNGNPTPADIAHAYKTSQLPVYDQPKDILKFLEGWAKHTNGVIKQSSIKERYGTLVAQG